MALVLEFAYYSFCPLHLELKWQTRPIWAKSIPIFRPKRRKKPHRLGRHMPICLISGSTPPPPPGWPPCSRTLPPTEEKRGKGLATRRLPPVLAQCKRVFVYYTGAIWYICRLIKLTAAY